MRIYKNTKGMPKKTYPPINWKRVNTHRVAGKVGAYNRARKEAMERFGLTEEQVPPRITMADVYANVHDSKALRTFERQLTAIRKPANFRVNPETGRLAYLDQLAYRVMQRRVDLQGDVTKTHIWETRIGQNPEYRSLMHPEEVTSKADQVVKEYMTDFWIPEPGILIPHMTPEEVKAGWDEVTAGWYAYAELLLEQIYLYWGGTWEGDQIVDIIRALMQTNPDELIAAIKTAPDEASVSFFYPLDGTRDNGKGKVPPGLVPDDLRLRSALEYWADTYGEITGSHWFFGRRVDLDGSYDMSWGYFWEWKGISDAYFRGEISREDYLEAQNKYEYLRKRDTRWKRDGE